MIILMVVLTRMNDDNGDDDSDEYDGDASHISTDNLWQVDVWL